MLRVGETLGTEFGNRGIAMGGMPNELWFRRGLLRHRGLMTPDNVADAMVAMVSLPPMYQYDVVSVSPTAPVGDLPHTLEEWQAEFMSRLPTSATRLAAGPVHAFVERLRSLAFLIDK